ncbi:hypothetical protein BB560_005377 [Smittium megazygosporum]|uniref:Aldehyde dehydrogenase domain-containing protein n=1 Tax=Smittium megazygosporum TaxID=133381 RepID=A0A2T9Z6M9_9FUNG|nr:hypothetical protein BB560_005377 [Smittium megazygosporum]
MFSLTSMFLPFSFPVVTSLAVAALGYYIVFKSYFLESYRYPSKDIDVPIPKECESDWQEDNFISEPSISSKEDPRKITCYDPATGRILGYKSAASPSEVNLAAKKAYDAQRQWSKTTFAERRQVLRTICEFVIKNQTDLCKVAARDSGKTVLDAMLGEVLTTIAKLRWTIENGEQALKPSRRSTGFLMMYKLAMVLYQPRGVVGAIVSWNYPFHNSIGPVISAIFAGNGIVVKTSENVAFSSSYFLKAIRAALEAHGHSGDLVQFVTGYAETGSALVECPLISHITFIGSAPVGRKIMETASKNLTPVTLELGGKDVAIIMDDADMSQCYSVIMRSVFQNAGQNCIGIERVLVHEKLYDSFVSEMESRIENLRLGSGLEQGNGVDMGAMVMAQSFKFIQSLIKDAVDKGARLLAGGKPYNNPKYPKGHYFMPTLLADVTPDMEITRNEVFGPVMVIMKITSAADAVRVANSSPFGLGSSVFTSEPSTGRQIALALKCGMVNNNDFGVNYLCQSLPFGGVGISGYGRFAGIEGLRSMCVEKSYTEDLFRSVKTKIPPVVDYPIKDISNAIDFTSSINTFAYGSSLVERVKAVFTLAKNA